MCSQNETGPQKLGHNFILSQTNFISGSSKQLLHIFKCGSPQRVTQFHKLETVFTKRKLSAMDITSIVRLHVRSV